MSPPTAIYMQTCQRTTLLKLIYAVCESCHVHACLTLCNVAVLLRSNELSWQKLAVGKEERPSLQLPEGGGFMWEKEERVRMEEGGDDSQREHRAMEEVRRFLGGF